MKRLLALLLSILLMVQMVPLAFAQSNAEVTVTSASAICGENVTITVSVKNCVEAKSIYIVPQYDDEVLEIVSGTWLINGMLADDWSAEFGDAAIAFSANTDVNTDIFELEFKVKENADVGDIASVSCEIVVKTMEGKEEIAVTTVVSSGTITIICNHTDTTNVPQTPADCDEGGYTAGVWCNDCETYISGHEPISATGNHTDADGKWESDEVNHFRTCACGHIFDTAAHSGGTATCKGKAKCSVCGAEYGQLNATNHTGGTTIVNASEPNHKTQQAGYTGDTKCLGCGEIIEYGQPIEPDTHTPAEVWSNDETHHWKECNVVGCGVVIDGSKALHSSDKTENKATCQKQAVCDVCGVSYGELASHNYTAEDKKQDTLKTEGNCRDNAVYYYSCSVCGLVENNANHTFLGDKVATAHVGGTTLVNQADANHKTQTDGYTGDTKCLGCNEIIAYGQAIPAGAHTPTSNWTTDGTYHWKVCTVDNCGVIIEGTKAEHTATGTNVATCKTQAICDTCDTAHGTLNAENHTGGTTTVNAAEPNHETQVDGYTGDTKCLGCNEIIAYGQSIPVGAHTPANVWSNDSKYHWKECTVVGCGIVIDGSKGVHTSTGANVATCQKLAVCDVCNVSYGDFADHDWNTTSWEKSATGHWHKCDTAGCNEKSAFAGHTPDHDGSATEEYAIKCTVCQYEIEAQLGHTHVFDKEVATEQYLASKANCTDPAKYYKSCKCGEKGTETFTSGTKLGHTEGTAWEKDADNHWHICTVAGCGVVIESSKAAHTPDHQGGATEEYAIKCSVCGWIIEQQLAHTHVFDQEVVDEQYKVSGATCLKPAIYYKSCACGEKGTETFENGEVIDHTEGTEWKSDADNHWHICTIAGCGVVIESSKAAHTSDRAEATETDAVKCSVCGYVITPALGHTHAYGTDWKSDANNHWNECACGDKANIAAHKDENTDSKCDVCAYNVGVPTTPTEPSKPSDNPQTGDNSMMWLWIALLFVSGFGVVATTVLGKKRSVR